MRISSMAQGLALGLLFIAAPAVSRAQIGIGISIRIGPPALPVYVQPPCPLDGYLWTPGYWAYGPDGYYWVPGVWIAPPRPGLLWTPGYWGPHIGFYGGVNYGFGYTGVGFIGGAWQGNVFRYNTAVVNVNTTVVRNVYVDRTVINNTTVVNRASFNGPGGVNAQPTPQQRSAMSEPHVQPTPTQMSHEQTASHDRGQLASVNHGRPAAAALEKPGGRQFGTGGTPRAGVQHANAMNSAPHNNAPPREATHQERQQQAPHNSKPPAEHPHPEKEGHGKP